MTLSRARCFNHPEREAVALCPECGRCFCRECVSEHEGRLLCALCIDRLFASRSRKGRRLTWFIPLASMLLGFLLLWSSCYLLGRLLIAIPSPFHNLQGPWGGTAQ